MKKILTLAAASVLAAGAFNAQAQVTLDGQLTAAEITAGNYVLIGKSDNFTFTGTQNQNDNRPFGARGLLGLYVATTATKVYIFLGGTVDPTGNSFQIYLSQNGVAGVPANTFLPVGTAGTSFEKINRIKLDQPVTLALALRGDGTPTGTAPQPYKVEAAVFSSATAIESRQLTTTASPVLGDGTALTLSSVATAAPYAGLSNARTAYRNTSDGKIGTNPGNVALFNTPAYAGVGSFGWEIELDRAALGATAADAAFRIFAIYNNGNGGYASGEFIPKATGALPAALPSPNLGGADNGATGNDVDFGAIPGLQSAGFSLGATGVLSNRTANAAALRFGMYPNPGAAVNVTYVVPQGKQQVALSVYDAIGKQVRTSSSVQAGAQSYQLSGLRAGIYVVKLNVGGQETSGKVVIE